MTVRQKKGNPEMGCPFRNGSIWTETCGSDPCPDVTSALLMGPAPYLAISQDQLKYLALFGPIVGEFSSWGFQLVWSSTGVQIQGHQIRVTGLKDKTAWRKINPESCFYWLKGQLTGTTRYRLVQPQKGLFRVSP